eukprot:3476305-Pyramimonas_sp.AAC.1
MPRPRPRRDSVPGLVAGSGPARGHPPRGGQGAAWRRGHGTHGGGQRGLQRLSPLVSPEEGVGHLPDWRGLLRGRERSPAERDEHRQSAARQR